MAKRRTRKQKQKARQRRKRKLKAKKTKPDSNLKQAKTGSAVKGQSLQAVSRTKKVEATKKSPMNKVKSDDLATIKNDIIKSLSLSGLILGTELVLYLFLQ